MSLKLKFIGDKGKTAELRADPSGLMLRIAAKQALKLQVPTRYIVLSKTLFDSRPKKLMTVGEENVLIKDIASIDTIYVAVAPFDIGMNCHVINT